MDIVKPRQDGRVHYADAEIGDLFYQDGAWWVVTMLGEWRSDDNDPHLGRRTGNARLATIPDAVGLLADINARLRRIERATSSVYRTAK